MNSMNNKLEKLTNNELLRKLQDLSEEYERKKSEVIFLCKYMDNVEIEHKEATIILNNRMSGKK